MFGRCIRVLSVIYSIRSCKQNVTIGNDKQQLECAVWMHSRGQDIKCDVKYWKLWMWMILDICSQTSQKNNVSIMCVSTKDTVHCKRIGSHFSTNIPFYQYNKFHYKNKTVHDGIMYIMGTHKRRFLYLKKGNGTTFLHWSYWPFYVINIRMPQRSYIWYHVVTHWGHPGMDK